MPEWNEVKEKLNADMEEVRSGLTIASMRTYEQPDGSFRISAKDAALVEKLFDVFKSLRWKLLFDLSKELAVDHETPVIRKKALLGSTKCGDLVKVRSCRKEHGDGTFLGIFLGEIATSVGHRHSGGVVTASPSMHNPAMFVPELGDIVYGYESFWSRIESEEDLSTVITEDTIRNVWYVQALRDLGARHTGGKDVQEAEGAEEGANGN